MFHLPLNPCLLNRRLRFLQSLDNIVSQDLPLFQRGFNLEFSAKATIPPGSAPTRPPEDGVSRRAYYRLARSARYPAPTFSRLFSSIETAKEPNRNLVPDADFHVVADDKAIAYVLDLVKTPARTSDFKGPFPIDKKISHAGIDDPVVFPHLIEEKSLADGSN